MIATKGTPELQNKDRASPLLQNFLSRCLVVEADRRANTDELLAVRGGGVAMARGSRQIPRTVRYA